MSSKITCPYSIQLKYAFQNINNVPLGGFLKSDFIKVEDSSYYLELYPNGTDEANKDFIGLYLGHKGPSIHGDLVFKIIKPVGSTGNKDDFTSSALNYDFQDGNFIYGLPQIIPRTRYMDYESLTVECTFTIAPKTILLQDFSALCFCNDFSDIRFKVEDQTIPAHKVILALHSPVFKAMLQSGMTEATSGEIVIDDFSAESFKAFLTCLYSQRASLLIYPYDMCVDICKLADKYQVVPLLHVCFLHLEATMKVDSCIDLLCLCHTYEWTQLKEDVIKFIASHKKLLLKSQITALKSLSDDLFHEIVNAM